MQLRTTKLLISCCLFVGAMLVAPNVCYSANEGILIHRDFNKLLGLLYAVFAIIAASKRKDAIGGWLIFMIFYIYASFVVASIVMISKENLNSLVPSSWNSHRDYFIALFSSVVWYIPRLINAVLVTVLLWDKRWKWIQYLKVVNVATIASFFLMFTIQMVYSKSDEIFGISEISVVVSYVIFLAYLNSSKRVSKVFKSHTWNMEHSGMSNSIEKHV